MRYELRPSDSRVMCDAHAMLERHEVRIFTTKALTHAQHRSLKAHGIHFEGDLDQHGCMRFSIEAAHIKRLLRDKDPKVVVRGWSLANNRFALVCEGDLAELIVNRVNALLKPRATKRFERKRRQKISAARKKRLEEKRKKLEEARKARKKPAPKKKDKTKKAPIPAPFTLEYNVVENQTVLPIFPQRRNITWHEAVRATVTIFKVKGDEYISATEKIHFELRRSLANNGGRCAIWKRGRFRLRFDLVTAFCGDLTKLRIACTNNTEHPLYARTLEYFNNLLVRETPAQVTAWGRLYAALEEEHLKIAA